MSTCYYFCDPARKAHIEYLADHWDDLKANMEQIFKDFCAKAPSYSGAKELEEDLIEKLDEKRFSRYGFLPDVEEENKAIGVATGKGFHWRHENGFYDLRSVEKYKEEHPEEEIFDEYGVKIPMKTFKKVIL